MTLNKKLTLLILTITLTSCASGPSQEQLANADYGRAMTATECISIAEQVVASGLRDPSSAQFNHGAACYQGWVSSSPILGLPVGFGWLQRGQVNGRNAYGGYVGFTPYLVLIKNGRAERYCITDSDGLCMPIQL